MDVLDLTGLAHRSAIAAGGLSLLDLKRLEFAKAIACRPRLLLLDEIAGGLTDYECDDLLEIVRTVHAEGATIVWIEHVIHALRRVATRLAVLYGGVIISSGEPETVLADPRVREVYLGVEA
jgi:branched-chain amino acid transport system ATP-binding protein